MCLHRLSAGPQLTRGCSRYLLISVRGQWTSLPCLVLSGPLCWCAFSTLIYPLRGVLPSRNLREGGEVKRGKVTQTFLQSYESGGSIVDLPISSQLLDLPLQANATLTRREPKPSKSKWIVQSGHYGAVQFMGLYLYQSKWCHWKKWIHTNWFSSLQWSKNRRLSRKQWK